LEIISRKSDSKLLPGTFRKTKKQIKTLMSESFFLQSIIKRRKNYWNDMLIYDIKIIYPKNAWAHA
jgi:hypothetical protein